MRLLIAEDDGPLAEFLSKALSEENYAVDVAPDAATARLLAQQCSYDLAILDVNLPDASGLDVLREIRGKQPALPVLLLTARSRVEDRVKGLDLGADDYLAKPFSFGELSARLRALLRRGGRPLDLILRVGDLELSRVERTVSRAGRRIDLSQKEFALLEYLMRNAGRPVTRTMIIENVWNLSFDSMTNVVDVYINYLRKKVDEGFGVRLIRTVRGVGYQLGGE